MLKLIPLMMLMFAGVQSVLAQVSHPPEFHEWEGTPFGGGSFVPNYSFLTPVATGNQIVGAQTVGVNYANGYQIGIQGKQNLGDYWEADLEYSFANQPLEFTNLTPSLPHLFLSHSIHHWSYSVSYQFLSYHRRFRPYARLGAGAALFFIHEDSRDEAAELGIPLRDSWKFTTNYGGGFKYLIDNDVALTFDATDQLSGIPSYGLPQKAQIVNGVYQAGLARNGLMNNVQVNFGVTFRWDNW